MNSNEKAELLLTIEWIFLLSIGMLFFLSMLEREMVMEDYFTGFRFKFLGELLVKVFLYMLLSILAQYVDYRIYYYYSIVLYAMSMLLIVLSGTSYGITEKGVTRWIAIGYVEFPVVEAAKVVMILMLAYVEQIFSDWEDKRNSRTLVLCVSGSLMSIFLLVFCKDYQTVLIVLTITFVIIAFGSNKDRLQKLVFILCGVGDVWKIFKVIVVGITLDGVLKVGIVIAMSLLYLFVSLYAIRVGSEAGSVFGRIFAYGVAIRFTLLFLFGTVLGNDTFLASGNEIGVFVTIVEIALVLSIERCGHLKKHR